MKKVLFAVRTAPYGSAAIPESVRSCLGFATMPFEISYLLMDDATWALQPGQAPAGIAAPLVRDLIGNLADLDVNLYVDSEALQERGVSAEGLAFTLTPASPDEISELIGSADVVLTY